MTASEAGTKLTLLCEGRDVSGGDLEALYRYPEDLDRPWVRSNFISSLDGGATVEGLSGGLAGPGDRSLFNVMRTLCDVVVVGAGTVKLERYGGAQLSASARAARERRGQAELPPVAVVTDTGRLDRDMKVFTHTEVRPLVLTSADAVPEAQKQLFGVAEVLGCSGADRSRVDTAVLLDRLGERGLLRVLTEGGPTLHASFIEAGLLDELCMTIAPVIVGGQARRISTGPGQVDTEMKRAHLLADESGYLYTRYVRAR
ncbi:pyrimidine reductase family protein [Mycolicibacterium brumae]|uniref:Pyrimidine reductase family protein n=1 Tax=Mycolicibacterium brumae TaxID=85968 RepID=A0A2G5PCP2_9MYCO|nr:pyrimidine reductase family protein [Mycolicibacterium brumae]MCV7193538.1 pyrimidine reductase family protein [Mycolicibacterium brumae]PIB76115.1 pyrimidine reductase family protein [Mycolicibacterium brumae]RWA17236.1 hypothetical protein MBRU_06320 [Mycolicibacterium brumae DSM 44177]UWW09190.1 pyrimidine reductase family protein [Mycolicibacterium brumae]